MKYNAIIIAGPTGTGKTSLSVKLAKKLNTEIINADSTQVYAGLNIGVAKATCDEMQGIKHHLIDICDLRDNYTVAQFKEQALQIIKDLNAKQKPAIIVGGTGFYIDSLLNNYEYGQSSSNQEIRNNYLEMAKEKGNETVHNELNLVDEVMAKKLHPNDITRVVRALEIYHTTGISASQHSIMQNATRENKEGQMNALLICLNIEDRKELYNKLNLRVDTMFANGLLQEVQSLYNAHIDRNWQSMKSIGYKELFQYLDTNITLEEAKELIKKNTRNYAKRQLTWFRRYNNNPNCFWFDVSKQSIGNIIDDIISKLK